MKKVLGAMAGILFAVFCVAILGLLMSFTMGARRKLFPDSFINQMWGLVLFDIAAMIWGLAFVFKSASVGQYAASGIGFATGFIGTLLMVTFEVITSGQTFVTDNGSLGRWAVYGFIIVTAIHAALVYFFHATDPQIHEKINIGIARGEISTEAIRQATSELEVEKARLASAIHGEIVSQVHRDLGIAVDPSVGFVAAQNNSPYVLAARPASGDQPKKETWFERMKNTVRPQKHMNKNEQTVVQQVELKEESKPISDEYKRMYRP